MMLVRTKKIVEPATKPSWLGGQIQVPCKALMPQVHVLGGLRCSVMSDSLQPHGL